MIGMKTHYAVVNSLGNEESRYLFENMAQRVAKRFAADAGMKTGAPYFVVPVERDAPRIEAQADGGAA